MEPVYCLNGLKLDDQYQMVAQISAKHMEDLDEDAVRFDENFPGNGLSQPLTTGRLETVEEGDEYFENVDIC